MALVQLQALYLNTSTSSFPSKSSISSPAAADVASWGHFHGRERRSEKIGIARRTGRIRSSLQENALVIVTIGQVTEVTKDTFWPLVGAAADRTVVLDMYTQWCGPCKVMAPKFQQLSEKYADVVFLKLDCNQDNKPLAKELGIKVVPTFKILKDGKVVKEVTGAKFDDLVAAIEVVRSSS